MISGVSHYRHISPTLIYCTPYSHRSYKPPSLTTHTSHPHRPSPSSSFAARIRYPHAGTHRLRSLSRFMFNIAKHRLRLAHHVTFMAATQRSHSSAAQAIITIHRSHKPPAHHHHMSLSIITRTRYTHYCHRSCSFITTRHSHYR